MRMILMLLLGLQPLSFAQGPPKSVKETQQSHEDFIEKSLFRALNKATDMIDRLSRDDCIQPGPTVAEAESKIDYKQPGAQAEFLESGWKAEWDEVVKSAVTQDMFDYSNDDLVSLCQKYPTLNSDKKREFWAHFVKSVAKAENSRFKINARFIEHGISALDPVTKTTVASEGLLQISYGDQYGYGCNMNWEQDRKLAASDPKKTIFDPRVNLECGVKILSKIMSKRGRLIPSPYWAVLQPRRESAYARFRAAFGTGPSSCRGHVQGQNRVVIIEEDLP